MIMTCLGFSHALSESKQDLRARGAPHEHKFQANNSMGSTLGFVKMQCPKLTDAQTHSRKDAASLVFLRVEESHLASTLVSTVGLD